MNISRNIKSLKLMSFFNGIWPLSAMMTIYAEQITGSYALALLFYTVAKIVGSVCELPTSILSDKLSRKSTINISYFIFIISYILIAFGGEIKSIELLFLAAALWGLADAFYSGTDTALIYETMQRLDKEEDFKDYFASYKKYNQIGWFVTAMIATIVTYFYSLGVLAWISLVPITISFIISLFIIDPEITTNDKSVSGYKHLKNAILLMVKNKKLRKLSLLQAFNNISYVISELEAPYFQTLIPLWVINIAKGLKQFCGITSFHIVKYLKNIPLTKVLFISSFGSALIRLTGIILNNTISPFIMSCTNLFYGTEHTSQMTLLQKELSKNQRATMESVVNFICNIFGGITLYLCGLIADIYSVRVAILVVLVFKFFMAFMYYRFHKNMNLK